VYFSDTVSNRLRNGNLQYSVVTRYQMWWHVWPEFFHFFTFPTKPVNSRPEPNSVYIYTYYKNSWRV